MASQRIFARRPQTFEMLIEHMTVRVTAGADYAEESRAAALAFWEELSTYMVRNPQFARSKRPVAVGADAPPLVRALGETAARAGVGPVFALRGALTDHVGRFLSHMGSEVTVSCGGDVYVASRRRTKLTVVRGSGSVGDVALVIDPARGRPQGVSTGTELTGGAVDALAVVASSCAAAASCAAGASAILRKAGSLRAALQHIGAVSGVLGGVVVLGEVIGVTGPLELAS